MHAAAHVYIRLVLFLGEDGLARGDGPQQRYAPRAHGAQVLGQGRFPALHQRRQRHAQQFRQLRERFQIRLALVLFPHRHRRAGNAQRLGHGLLRQRPPRAQYAYAVAQCVHAHPSRP